MLIITPRVIFILLFLICSSIAANVTFEDCLNPIKNKPYFVPNKVDAKFINSKGSDDNVLKYEIFGSVNNGQFTDLDQSTNMYTTLKIESHVLQYELYSGYKRFCDQAKHGCPFDANSSFLFEYNVSSSYQGATFDTTFYIIDPTTDADVIGCVSVSVSPVLAGYVWYVLIFGILAIFILMCISYVLTVVLNPWTGTLNIYMSTSNFGHDPNSIRLLTPGILDFLKYLQFAFFCGTLSLDFPGFFRPILGSISWSGLLFGVNFVSPNDREDEIEDDIYAIHGKFGMSKMARDLTFVHDQDIWPAFIVWLLVITIGILIICLMGVGVAWGWKKINKNDHLNLRSRLSPFLGGVLIRIFIIGFGWPLLAFSFFELLIIRREDSSIVADIFAAVIMLGWVGLAGLISYRVHNTHPRQRLFDDLPTLLLYGPLYNTYTESKAMFFMVDLFITLIRGLTTGAIQDSGLAQITLLATIELTYLIALICLRPYNAITNMNFISITMSIIRIIQIFLLIPFVGSLGINPVVKGWIAYTILIIHGFILILCFIHVVQVIIEIFALMSSSVDTTAIPTTATSAADNTAAVYGMKMLSKRKQKDDDGDEGNNKPLMEMKDVSPTSIIVNNNNDSSSSSGDNRIFPPVAKNTSSLASSTGYYRKPRRRQNSHDWAYGVPRNVEEEEAEQDQNRDEEFSFIDENRNVNYAVREADIYYTPKQDDEEQQRGDSGSNYDEYYDEEDDDYFDDSRNRNSGNPLINHQQSTSDYGEDDDEEDNAFFRSGNLTNSVKGIISKVKTGIHRFQNNGVELQEEEELQSTGFQVVNRKPIKPKIANEDRLQPYQPKSRPNDDFQFNNNNEDGENSQSNNNITN